MNYVDYLGLEASDIGQFQNNTNIPHVTLPEQPDSKDYFNNNLSKNKKEQYIENMITDSNSPSKTNGVDTLFNPLTGEAVKVPTGAKVTANQDAEGNVTYKINPVMKLLGSIASNAKNVKNFFQGKDSHYYSKPGVYKQGEYPTDIQHQLSDYPYIETAIEKAKEKYEEQQETVRNAN